MRNRYVSQAFKLKKRRQPLTTFEKRLDWTGFKLAPNDFNDCYDELAGEFTSETKKYFK